VLPVDSMAEVVVRVTTVLVGDTKVGPTSSQGLQPMTEMGEMGVMPPMWRGLTSYSWKQAGSEPLPGPSRRPLASDGGAIGSAPESLVTGWSLALSPAKTASSVLRLDAVLAEVEGRQMSIEGEGGEEQGPGLEINATDRE